MGSAFELALAARRTAGAIDIAHPAVVIPRTVAEGLVTDLGLDEVEDAMILSRDAAVAIARPPISRFRVGVVGAGAAYDDIVEAWLAVPREAVVNHEAPTRDLLAAAAPGVTLHVTYWS